MVRRLNTPGREPEAAICFFMNLSNIAAFWGNESPGCVHEKDPLLGWNAQQPCSEQFVSIFQNHQQDTRWINLNLIDHPSHQDAHVHVAIPLSHFIKQRLLCNLWVLHFHGNHMYCGREVSKCTQISARVRVKQSWVGQTWRKPCFIFQRQMGLIWKEHKGGSVKKTD